MASPYLVDRRGILVSSELRKEESWNLWFGSNWEQGHYHVPLARAGQDHQEQQTKAVLCHQVHKEHLPEILLRDESFPRFHLGVGGGGGDGVCA